MIFIDKILDFVLNLIKRSTIMVFIGDYFALGLVIILCMFFFDSKTGIRYMPTSSKLFVACLFMTAITAITDLITGYMLTLKGISLWKNMLGNTLYFMVNIITTSFIALYLFTKILEHTHTRHCMRNACIGLAALFVIYTALVVSNIWTGLLFFFEEDGTYCRGSLNAIGYAVTLAQMGLVLICFFRNKETASRPMRRVLIQIFPVIPLCILIQRLHPEIMLNAILIAFVDAVLFMTFMGQRNGVHSLTELNDRHRFFTEVDYRISQKEPFQIYLINLKNFGAVNQKYGHLFGDEFLYQFAFSLEKLLKGGLSFHMNGTVFATILRYTYQDAADKQSGILLDFLEKGIECDGHQVDTEYVLSHYISDGRETTAMELYENMEYASSKAYGMKHRYIRCTHEIREEVVRRRYLRERIQKIDRAHGFEVWFQPAQCMKTGKFCSMEALIRLREPDGKLISPAEFIPLAEQTGQVSSITWFVLEEVCRMLKYNTVPDDTSVSINMPMAQLIDKGFVPRFMGIVDQAGISHHRICIEFTEYAILDNFDQTLNVMKELTGEGFRFYLDDFGAGYSNFNCLLQLPFHVIKLDIGIVHAMKNGRPDYSTVQALTRLFHDRDLIVVAEGAENQEEVQALAERGVDIVQGFALARPMSENDLFEFYNASDS